MKLRDYQQFTKEAVLDNWRPGLFRLISMATGMGKTATAQAILEEFPPEQFRILVVVQSLHLIKNFMDPYYAHHPDIVGTKEDPRFIFHEDYSAPLPVLGVEANTESSPNARIVVAMRQTLAGQAGERLWNSIKIGGPFDVVVIDEAHHSVADQYEVIMDICEAANPDVRVLGMTATLRRNDDLSLGIMFHELVQPVRDISFGITQGWLSPVDLFHMKVKVPFGGDDFDYSNQLNAMLVANWQNMHWKLLSENRFNWKNRHTLHFMPSVESSRRWHQFLLEQGVPAAHVDGGLTIDENGVPSTDTNMSHRRHREQVLDRIQSGDIQYVTNRLVFTEGWDWRHCNMVVISGNPSPVVFTQMVGRGSRLPPGVNRMLVDQEKGQYEVHTDGGIRTYTRENLPFHPSTIVINAGDHDGGIVTASNLLGKTKVNEIEINEDLVDDDEAADDSHPIHVTFSVTATDIVLKTGSLFSNIGEGEWYTCPQKHDSSAYLGQIEGTRENFPYTVYLLSPEYDFKHKMLKSNFVDFEAHENRQERNFWKDWSPRDWLWEFCRGWSVWLVWGVRKKSSFKFTDAKPAYFFLPEKSRYNVDFSYQSRDQAITASAFFIDYMLNYVDQQYDLRYDRDSTKAFRRNASASKYKPSEAQMNYLAGLVSRVRKSGWKSVQELEVPRIADRNGNASRFVASQAINHYMAAGVIYNKMQDIAEGKDWLTLGE